MNLKRKIIGDEAYIEVGKLPDGRVIKSFQFITDTGQTHYIYFVDETVSANYIYGKSPVVEVLIDGKAYTPVDEKKTNN